MRVTFDYCPLRFHFIAHDLLRVGLWRAGNLFRGALGAALHRVAPDAFARIFDAEGGPQGPSGLGDRPRPFVLRVREVDGATIEPGGTFTLGVNLFDLGSAWAEWFAAGFTEAGTTGFGPTRARATLDRVEASAPVHLSLTPEPLGVAALAIDFLTPTELKPVSRPDFGVVFSRARDRVATLCSLYGGGMPDFDFRGLGRLATRVRTLRVAVQAVDIGRRSARTGQVHGIGGFTGTADYSGDLDEFLPVLNAATAAGVGRHTVWGNGEIRIRTGLG